jgi:hypothetical protein
MDDYLDHAQALERTKGFEPGRILTERLAPDMVTFGEQFSVSCNKVDAHMAKLMQRDRPAPRNIPMMYPALKGRLLETRGFLQNVQPDEDAAHRARVVWRRRLHPAPGAARLLLPHLDCARDPPATSERRSGSATTSATSLSRVAVTTRERRARCAARVEAFKTGKEV